MPARHDFGDGSSDLVDDKESNAQPRDCEMSCYDDRIAVKGFTQASVAIMYFDETKTRGFGLVDGNCSLEFINDDVYNQYQSDVYKVQLGHE